MEMTEWEKMQDNLFGKKNKKTDIEYRVERIEKCIDHIISIFSNLYLVKNDLPKTSEERTKEKTEEKTEEIKEKKKIKISTVAKNVGDPDAIFEKSDPDTNLRFRITVWIEELDNESNQIICYTDTSKLDGSNAVNTRHIVSRKGITNFTTDEIPNETERYYQKLIDDKFIRIK